jgi:flagellar motor component MotA
MSLKGLAALVIIKKRCFAMILFADYYQGFNLTLTDAEKEECVPTIAKMVKYAEIARLSGILNLVDELESETDIFIKASFIPIIEGEEAGQVAELLQNMITADRPEGVRLLEKLIIAYGAMLILEGLSPNVIEKYLCTLLGEKYLVKLMQDRAAGNL